MIHYCRKWTELKIYKICFPNQCYGRSLTRLCNSYRELPIHSHQVKSPKPYYPTCLFMYAYNCSCFFSHRNLTCPNSIWESWHEKFHNKLGSISATTRYQNLSSILALWWMPITITVPFSQKIHKFQCKIMTWILSQTTRAHRSNHQIFTR